ncbi:MAG: hypothetical protein AAGG02_10590 [Cyanobacteria bacterium P01_H01_bin.15]
MPGPTVANGQALRSSGMERPRLRVWAILRARLNDRPSVLGIGRKCDRTIALNAKVIRNSGPTRFKF